MNRLIIIMLASIIVGCSSAAKVRNSTDIEVCEKHADYSIQKNKAGIQLTLNEIEKRNIDIPWCLNRANSYIEKNSPRMKLEICQRLALYNFKGVYTHYSKTLETIKSMGFFDKECEKMAQLYNVSLRRDRLESEALAEEFDSAPKKSKVILMKKL